MAGHIIVATADRSAYLEQCLPVIQTARDTAGCLDFHLAPDPLDVSRINVFEAWETAGALEEFRGSGSDDAQNALIVSAVVRQYVVTSANDLTA